MDLTYNEVRGALRTLQGRVWALVKRDEEEIYFCGPEAEAAPKASKTTTAPTRRCGRVVSEG
jgi:hypothetical protein